MILIGTRTKELGRTALPGSCPHCKEDGQLELFILAKYFTLYGAAVFPVEKLGIAGCNACQTTFVKEEMPPQMRTEAGLLMNNYSQPFYSYALGIVVAIIVLASFLMW